MNKRSIKGNWLTLSLLCITAAVSSQPLRADNRTGNPDRGEYLLHVSGCIHCHTAEDGERLAGGRALETPFGVFYTPNITPHPSAGIGRWQAADFRRALRHGSGPDGASYFPAFPFTAYTRMHDEDMDALFEHLMSRPASDRANREHDLPWYLSWRIGAWAWQWLFFDAGAYESDPTRSASWNRGAYIAEALGHCGECHTPRNRFGALRQDAAYAGTDDGPDGEKVPNITSHPESGIGDWSDTALHQLLQYGELPNGEYVAGSMEYVIEATGRLSESDRSALVEYLKTIPPQP